jgi:hypothetical protein
MSRIPGVASVADMFKNSWGMFNLGFNPKNASIPINGTPFKGQFSLGGMATFGGLAMGGAAIGAALGSQMEGDMIGPAAAVGAGIGALALPAAGLAVRGGTELGKGLFKAGAAIAPRIPGAAMSTGGFALSVMKNAPMIGRVGGAGLLGFTSMMVDWDATKNVDSFLGSVKLSGPLTGFKEGFKAGKTLPGKLARSVGEGLPRTIINGKTILWGSSVVAGAASAFSEMNKAHMGQLDNQITSSTVRTPSYANNAGASGDLVFALNANRRG